MTFSPKGYVVSQTGAPPRRAFSLKYADRQAFTPFCFQSLQSSYLQKIPPTGGALGRFPHWAHTGFT